MERSASAKWQGDLKSGAGAITLESKTLDNAQYSFGTRFESGNGTNPEELLGASHAGCFSMALSMILGQSELTADEINTKATVTLEQVDGGFSITKVHLELKAKIPGASEQQFMEAANAAKENCPISKVLNATITMDAELVS